VAISHKLLKAVYVMLSTGVDQSVQHGSGSDPATGLRDLKPGRSGRLSAESRS
jgi:hypothetical protein